MTQLRYVAIAVVILAGCRKETRPAPATGSGAATAVIDAAIPVSSPDPAGPPDAATPPRPAAQGEQCPDGTPCDTGLTCVKFVGVTGRQLETCEIPCDKGAKCPTGQACASVKDGPGQVCQPGRDGGSAAGSSAPGGKGSGAPGGKGGVTPSGKGSGSGPGGSAPAARQGEPCATGPCAPGLACVEYYGIAGPRGGKFTSCEIRCGGGGRCPGGQQCVTIADGPGQVCRP